MAYGFDVEMLAGQAVTAADAPVRPCGVPLGDPVTAMAAAAAVLAALWRRRLDGCVAHVELAQRDALLHQLAPRCAAARRGERWPADHLAGEPAHDARTPEAVLNDPRLRQGGGLIDVVDEDGVVRPYPTAAIRFVGGPEPLARPAPAPETKTGERRELSAALPAR